MTNGFANRILALSLRRTTSRQGAKTISASLIIATFLGLLLLVYLIVDSGVAQVAHAMLVVGWGLLPVALYHFIPLLFSTLSWRELLPVSSRPNFISLTWIRWIRESINSLLPVAGVGGDFASTRLIHLRGVPGTQAAASMVIDTTVGVATQLVFVITGVVLLLFRSTDHAALLVAWSTLIGIAAFIVVIATFVLVQHQNMFGKFADLARRLLPGNWLSGLANSASAIDDAVVAGYRSGSPFWRANLLRLVGWVAGAGEIWLVMQFLGQPLNMIDAFILESITSGVRAAAFMVPGALGALEGSFVLLGALFGLPAESALAISLSKRVRELILGLPGLFVWHWVEGHYLLRHSEKEPR